MFFDTKTRHVSIPVHTLNCIPTSVQPLLFMRKILLLLTTCGLFSLPLTVQSQTTAFTYQGRLNLNTNPAAGIYDFRFTIYDAVTNGAVISGPLTNASVAVTSGVFTVTLDFGTAPFPGTNRWLDIGVRTNGSATFTALNPRQRVTAAPYSITAANFSGGLAGDVTGTQNASTVARIRGVNVAGQGQTSVFGLTIPGKG